MIAVVVVIVVVYRDECLARVELSAADDNTLLLDVGERVVLGVSEVKVTGVRVTGVSEGKVPGAVSAPARHTQHLRTRRRVVDEETVL